MTLPGPYLLLFWCYLPGTDERGSTYPLETRLLIGVLDNVNEPKPVVPEVPPDLRTILRSHVLPRSRVCAKILESDASRGT